MSEDDKILIHPKPLKHIYLPRGDTTFQDKNLLFLRNVLNKKGPMTIVEIQKEFERESRNNPDIKPKSDKSIYRYLGSLKDLGIVAQVGKRMYTENDTIKTITLFGVTANFFLIGTYNTPFHRNAKGKLLKRRKGLVEFIGEVLKHQYDGKDPDLDCLEEIMVDIIESSTEILIENFESISLDSIEKLISGQVEGDEGEYLMNLVTWLGLVIARKDLHNEVGKCFK
jgi:hypothetical protein